MIAGGTFGDSPVPDNLTEVVELVKTNSTPSFGQLPSIRVEAVGAIFGNTPIICGGYDYGSYYDFADTCISYQDSQCTMNKTGSNSGHFQKKR